MNELLSTKDILIKTLNNLWMQVADAAPSIFMALIIIFIGWIIAKFIKFIVQKGLRMIKLDEVAEKIKLTEVMNDLGIKIKFSKVLATIAYWIVMLVFLMAATEKMGIPAITDGIAAIVAYLPIFLTAMIVFVIGVLVASLVKKAVYSVTNSIGLSGAKAISNIVYYLLFIMVVITALNQAGLDTELITTYLIMVMGSMLIAFAVAYGFASRHIVGNILSSYYGKSKFQVGQKIEIGDIKGTIDKMDNLSVTINSDGKKIVVPSQRFLNEEVTILE